MKDGTRRSGRTSRACLVAVLMIVAAIPAGVVLAQPEPPVAPVEGTLERLAEVLGRLEAELAALEAPAAERLEEGLERIIELLRELLAEFDRPRDDQGESGVQARIVRLDLMLHRLLYILDEIVEGSGDTPARPRARAAVEDLRDWVDGYVGGMTAGMDPRTAERVERAAHEMVHDLAGRMADMAKRGELRSHGRPVLARLVERLEELLFRLDGFILHRSAQPPARG